MAPIFFSIWICLWPQDPAKQVCYPHTFYDHPYETVDGCDKDRGPAISRWAESVKVPYVVRPLMCSPKGYTAKEDQPGTNI